ncbi:MAG: hypothetical protein ACOX69_05015 [Coriobacteriales bacterium]|jgi:hypothetical protein
MHRTFEGFLKAYCAELSGMRTTNLSRLCRAANADAPRVSEPLFLLALERGKVPYLLELARGTRMEPEYRKLAESAAGYGDASSFLEETPDVPVRYRKVLEAWQAEGDSLAADRRMNSLMRPKILDSLERAGATRYRLCSELGLNRGNVYAYLAGDDSKVSHETAKRMLAWAQEQERDMGARSA